ncbi:NADH-ubiquinone oxidoreductase [Westerdykella ornata]|uniref:NADH-ubiquinone oxidoreductase n=1 Tax=Westerdykella ornata TaxID=318751 RepID=A0A6A6JVZ5_WESOR|nr:NADH-ubiquinone oxidoreductase [Westerdykella ornata]KAF2279896.1 NADH-ubiquinone oxidoreductase [Westerdykella ornata]
MLPRTLRTRGALRPLTSPPFILRASASGATATAHYSSTTPPTSNTPNQVPANDPKSRPAPPNVSVTNATPVSSEGHHDAALVEAVEVGEEMRRMQAPNREGVWSRSQQRREVAMSGPRFEQMVWGDQPRPYAAIELIHKQPVRWTHKRIVSCDGGGGPLGHPRIFINTDKPQICWCTYCGVPFANEHHRKHLESLPHTSYPLEPTGDKFEVGETQRVSDDVLGQR